MFGSALMLIGLAFMKCTQPMLAIAFLTAGVGIMGSSYSGFLVNHMDIAPKFAGKESFLVRIVEIVRIV